MNEARGDKYTTRGCLEGDDVRLNLSQFAEYPAVALMPCPDERILDE